MSVRDWSIKLLGLNDGAGTYSFTGDDWGNDNETASTFLSNGGKIRIFVMSRLLFLNVIGFEMFNL